MKTIKIKSLQLTNFKGIKNLKLDDLGQETSIYGDNGTGKTTVFDAFTWLLFGKDSSDRKDFEIKTLDANNNAIPKIDHSVSAVLEVDGTTIELHKTYREKWVKRKGSLEAEFSGNETLYEWNGVPMLAGEYASKIGNIVDESVFKMITSTMAFNGMKWQDQRQVLIDLAGHMTDADIALGNPDFEALVSKLEAEDKSLEEYKKQVKASISKSKADLKTIPTRIDEVERGKPETEDFENIKMNINNLSIRIDNVNTQMTDKAKAHQAELDKKRGIQADIYKVENEIDAENHKLKQQARDKYNSLHEKPRQLQAEIARVDGAIKEEEDSIKAHEGRIDVNQRYVHSIDHKLKVLMEDWNKVNATSFKMDDIECKCPTCQRNFEEDVIADKRAEMERMFNDDKRTKLEHINQNGQQLKSEKESLSKQIEASKSSIESIQSKVKTLWEQRADLSTALKQASNTTITEADIFEQLQQEHIDTFVALTNKIGVLKTQLQEVPQMDNTQLQEQLKELNRQRHELNIELQKEARIKEADERIAQLAGEEKQLAQTIATQEKEQYTIEAFEKAKSDRIETSVNSMFRYVNFKLFKTLINGGEEPTCSALVNGVPYSDANTASKINAGLDIINTLCTHYGVTAPIFIDNRESVVQLIYSPSQIINLVVSETDKKLRVASNTLEEVA